MKGCEETAEVRQTSGKGIKKRLYLRCPVHKQITNESPQLQDYIRKNAEFLDGVEVPPPAPKPAPVAAPPPAPSADSPAPTAAPKRTPFQEFNDWWDPQ